MSQAKSGDNVKVHYTGTLEDGSVFDSSKDREPLAFVLGSGMLIPGFDKAVEGMTVGDSKSVTLSPEDAYGPRRDEMMVEVKLSEFPDEIKPEVGVPLQVNQPNGQVVNVVIVEVKEETAVLDANHPLAGKTLKFDIELMEIGEAEEK